MPASIVGKMPVLRVLVALFALTLLGMAVLNGVDQARDDAAARLERELSGKATELAQDLEAYFERARAISLLLAESRAFREFYELGGRREAKIASGALPVRQSEAALQFLARLYPDDIGEACFIDASGAENARVVDGTPAHHDDLSPDESGTPFFRPTLRLPVGEVFQSRPYVSPDTGELVISNSTVVPSPDGVAHGLVHFEITLESFRRSAQAIGEGLSVVDESSGFVVFESATPMDGTGATRASPELLDAVRKHRRGLAEVGGVRVALQRVRTTTPNANDWYAIASAPAAPVPVLAAFDAATVGLAASGLALFVAAVGAFGLYERRARAERRAAAERLTALAENVSDLVTVVDSDGIVLFVTGPVEAALGVDAGSLVGSTVLDLVHADDRVDVATFLRRVASAESAKQVTRWRMRTASGAWGTFETTARNLIHHAGIRGLVLTTHDITQRQEFEDQLRHRAFHDPLTQLANRALFYDRVEHAVALARRSGHVAAVLFLDLDDFKIVNDSFGHATGDDVLAAFAQRLRGCLRSADTAARLGGDEFGVLVEGIGGVGEAVHAAERILSGMREPFAVHGRPLEIRPSIGIADSESVSGGADELLRAADLAMYGSKRAGRGRFELYSRELEAAFRPAAGSDSPGGAAWFVRNEEQRAEILSLLDRPGSIEPVFQPVVDLRTGRICAYEALARFPDRDGRPPNAWFAQAHRFGLGATLEAEAVRVALAVPARPTDVALWLNVSPSALVSAEIDSVLPANLDCLVFELTENELISGSNPLEDVLVRLRVRGARVAIDDAGSGYAGLRQLMRIRPEIVKLDRSLVHGVSADPTKAALIESFVRYATKIGGHVCAEGIETLPDLLMLAELDVAFGQGYAVGRPQPPWGPIESAAASSCADAAGNALRGRVATAQAQDAAERRLERIASRLSAVSSLAGLEETMYWVATELHARKCSISILHRAARVLETVAAPDRGAESTQFAVDDYALTKHVLETGEMAQVLASDPTSDPGEVAILEEEGARSVLMVPVSSAGVTVGLIEVYSTEERPWSREEMSRARVIASLVGPVLDRLLTLGEAREAA